MRKLRREIGRHEFLYIIDEASTPTSLAVIDRRSGLGVSVDSVEALKDLLAWGAEKYLESEHNFKPQR